jgi:hypothetical protein
MKVFKLPQLPETSVNNIKKTNELFLKYGLQLIKGSVKPYFADEFVRQQLKFIFNQPKYLKTYNRYSQMVLFFNEFEPRIGDEYVKKDVKTFVQNMKDANVYDTLQNSYLTDQTIRSRKDFQALLNARTENENQFSGDTEVVLDMDEGDWDSLIRSFIKNYFQKLPDTPDISPRNNNNNNNNNVQPQVIPMVSSPSSSSIWTPDFLNKIEQIVKSGTSYLNNFANGLSVRLGDSKTYHCYAYGVNLVNKDVSSFEEFVRKNNHLGKAFFTEIMPLLVAEEQKKPPQVTGGISLIGVNQTPIFPVSHVPTYIEDEAYLLSIINKEFIRAPSLQQGVDHDYVFGVLDEACFTMILSPSVVGALNRAKAIINRIEGCETFTLKELIMSPAISDVFQFRVAYEFLQSTGANAYVGRHAQTKFGKVDNTVFNLSAGYQQRKMLAAEFETSTYWLQDVHRVINPRLNELEQFIRECEYKLDTIEINLNDQEKIDIDTRFTKPLLDLEDKKAVNPAIIVDISNVNQYEIGTNSRKYFLKQYTRGLSNHRLSQLIHSRELDISLGLNNGTFKFTIKDDSELSNLNTLLRMRLAKSQLNYMPKYLLVHYE